MFCRQKTLCRVQKLVTLLQGQTTAFITNCFLCVFKFRKHVLSTKNIIIYKVRPIVAEDRIGIFINCFFCVLLVPQICFVDKKHCTVCKNSLHCLQRQTTAFITNCFLCVFKFQKHVLSTKKYYHLQSTSHCCRGQNRYFYQLFFCVLLVSQTRFCGQKTLYRVQKFVTFLCASMYNERRSL